MALRTCESLARVLLSILASYLQDQCDERRDHGQRSEVGQDPAGHDRSSRIAAMLRTIASAVALKTLRALAMSRVLALASV